MAIEKWLADLGATALSAPARVEGLAEPEDEALIVGDRRLSSVLEIRGLSSAVIPVGTVSLAVITTVGWRERRATAAFRVWAQAAFPADLAAVVECMGVVDTVAVGGDSNDCQTFNDLCCTNECERHNLVCPRAL
jgi:hypothetical protein